MSAVNPAKAFPNAAPIAKTGFFRGRAGIQYSRQSPERGRYPTKPGRRNSAITLAGRLCPFAGFSLETLRGSSTFRPLWVAPDRRLVRAALAD